MAGEMLALRSESIDILFGVSVLHHLDLVAVSSEISRVLKPGGRAIFVEPLAHHPIARLYRKLTPDRRSKDESPLDLGAIALLETHFRDVRTAPFHLTSLASVAFTVLNVKPLFDTALKVLGGLDASLFRWFPAATRYAWIAVIEINK